VPRYAGKAVAITGGGSGLGAAMADRFAAEGARLALMDIDGERAEAEAARLRAGGAEAYGITVDVADKASLENAAAQFAERYGACHALCANVGVQQFGAIEVLTEQDWQWVMSVNFHGAIQTVAAFLPLLHQAEGQRHIVLTASASYFQIGVRMAAYIASKYALVGYGEATRHLESSVAARPADLGASRLDMADIQAMIADAEIEHADHVATAEHAVRNLLDELDMGSPYIITHGNYRHQVEDQQRRILAAFDAMAAKP